MCTANNVSKIINQKKPVVLSGYNNCEIERKNSSSGGIFPAIAKYILDQGGVVFGARWDGLTVKHDFILNFADIHLLAKSKYIISDVRNTYRKTLEFLSDNKIVLYSGTPCQIEGLISFLKLKKAKMEKLYTIDLVCHGVPKIKYWKKYIRELNNERGIYDIRHIDFRSKGKGWSSPTVDIEYIDENYDVHHLLQGFSENPYTKLFEKGLSLRESCRNCKYRVAYSNSDFTLGDFWNFKEYADELFDNKGLSIIVCHSDKGEALINNIDLTIKSLPVSTIDSIHANNSYMSKKTAGVLECDMLSHFLTTKALSNICSKSSLCKRIFNKCLGLIKR